MTNFTFFSSGESFTVAICAVIASGILRGYSGFGAALIIIPIFSNLYSPLVALSFHVLIEMPSLVVLLPAAIRAYDRKLVNSSLLVLILAVPFGFFFVSISRRVEDGWKWKPDLPAYVRVHWQLQQSLHLH